MCENFYYQLVLKTADLFKYYVIGQYSQLRCCDEYNYLVWYLYQKTFMFDLPKYTQTISVTVAYKKEMDDVMSSVIYVNFEQ